MPSVRPRWRPNDSLVHRLDDAVRRRELHPQILDHQERLAGYGRVSRHLAPVVGGPGPLTSVMYDIPYIACHIPARSASDGSAAAGSARTASPARRARRRCAQRPAHAGAALPRRSRLLRAELAAAAAGRAGRHAGPAGVRRARSGCRSWRCGRPCGSSRPRWRRSSLADELMLCREPGDVERALAGGYIGIVLALEGCPAIGPDTGLLRTLWRLGVRVASLTHFGRNSLADGSAEDGTGSRLTRAGVSAVRLMQESACWSTSRTFTGGTRHVLDITQAPVLATHSSCRALRDITATFPTPSCGHRRHRRGDRDQLLPAVRLRRAAGDRRHRRPHRARRR